MASFLSISVGQIGYQRLLSCSIPSSIVTSPVDPRWDRNSLVASNTSSSQNEWSTNKGDSRQIRKRHCPLIPTTMLLLPGATPGKVGTTTNNGGSQSSSPFLPFYFHPEYYDHNQEYNLVLCCVIFLVAESIGVFGYIFFTLGCCMHHRANQDRDQSLSEYPSYSGCHHMFVPMSTNSTVCSCPNNGYCNDDSQYTSPHCLILAWLSSRAKTGGMVRRLQEC